MKKWFYIIGGCTLIALSYNVFFLPYDIISTGLFGIAELVSYETNYDPAIFILIINISFIIIAFLTLGKKRAKEYIIPGILIPIIIFLTANINDYISFDYLEYILVVIAASFLTGLGYSMLYKEAQNVGGIDVIQDIINSVKIYRSKKFVYICEGGIILATIFILNIESAIYSAIAITIIRSMATKSKIGVSTSKTFYILTKKEKEVKDYIMNDLHHDLTEFSVKGGYTNNKSKILMTVMDTKDYYRLKEGIMLIDSKAFISITDSYEVINKNVTINKAKKNKE